MHERGIPLHVCIMILMRAHFLINAHKDLHVWLIQVSETGNRITVSGGLRLLHYPIFDRLYDTTCILIYTCPSLVH